MSNPLVSQSQVVERLESQPWGAEKGEVRVSRGYLRSCLQTGLSNKKDFQ